MAKPDLCRVSIDRNNSLQIDLKMYNSLECILELWHQMMDPSQHEAAMQDKDYASAVDTMIFYGAWIPRIWWENPIHADQVETRKQSLADGLITPFADAPDVHLYELDSPAAPGILLANLIMQSSYTSIKDHFSWSSPYSQETHQHTDHRGHTITRVDACHFADVWLGALPRDEAGTVHAVHPLFTLGRDALLKMTSNKRFDLVTYLKSAMKTTLTRLVRDAPIPKAHADYQAMQGNVVHVSNYRTNCMPYTCRGCGRNLQLTGIDVENNRLALGVSRHAVSRDDDHDSDCLGKNIKPLTTTVNFPSGVLLCADQHRAPDYLGEIAGNFYINETYGRRDTNHYAAAQNFAHGCTWNASPNVYTVADKNIILVASGVRKTQKGDQLRKQLGWKNVGAICTDLWAYSIVDKDIMAARFPEWATPAQLETYMAKECLVVTCQPGEYVQICLADEPTKGSKTWKTHPEYLALPESIRALLSDISCYKMMAIFVNKAYLAQAT